MDKVVAGNKQKFVLLLAALFLPHNDAFLVSSPRKNAFFSPAVDAAAPRRIREEEATTSLFLAKKNKKKQPKASEDKEDELSDDSASDQQINGLKQEQMEEEIVDEDQASVEQEETEPSEEDQTEQVLMTKEEEETEEQPVKPEKEEESSTSSTSSIDDNWSFLQSLGAITGRGEFATKQQRASALKVASQLESSNPTPDGEALTSPLLQGKWELMYCSTELFRSSPFFMAGRAVCQTEDERKQYDFFCSMHRKALAISTIQSVRQVISADRLVSEFEVKAGAVPFLSDLTPFSYSGGWPVTIDGSLVSSADWKIPSSDNSTTSSSNAMELYMDTVQVKGSNIPGLRQALDNGLQLESRKLADLLEQNIANYSTPRPLFRVTYLDDKYRISRDQDDNLFVYVKTSSDPTPTDYSKIDADLGIGRLLEQVNDAVFQFYI